MVSQILSNLSLPLRVCGFNLCPDLLRRRLSWVTPLAGVWVEIAFTTIYSPGSLVTPLAGVWVEISMLCNAGLLLAGSLPLRECGLKSALE